MRMHRRKQRPYRSHFRLFSGHTQVNATDLRKMPYPSYQQLSRLGGHVKETMPDQEIIDAIVEKECESRDSRTGCFRRRDCTAGRNQHLVASRAITRMEGGAENLNAHQERTSLALFEGGAENLNAHQERTSLALFGMQRLQQRYIFP